MKDPEVSGRSHYIIGFLCFQRQNKVSSEGGTTQKIFIWKETKKVNKSKNSLYRSFPCLLPIWVLWFVPRPTRPPPRNTQAPNGKVYLLRYTAFFFSNSLWQIVVSAQAVRTACTPRGTKVPRGTRPPEGRQTEDPLCEDQRGDRLG